MKCLICNASLFSWTGNLVSCKGTATSARHKFYLKWRNPIDETSDENRELELAIAAKPHQAGKSWPVKDSVNFPSK